MKPLGATLLGIPVVCVTITFIDFGCGNVMVSVSLSPLGGGGGAGVGTQERTGGYPQTGLGQN